MRVANVAFAALFLFSVAVQYNDPDPLQWVAIYAAAFGCCVAWQLKRLPRVAPWVVLLAAVGWGVAIFAGLHLEVPFGEAVTDWKMHAGGSEELRESMGLGLVAAWMAALAWKAGAGPAPRSP
jgi:Transmembrane family 220, helix